MATVNFSLTSPVVINDDMEEAETRMVSRVKELFQQLQQLPMSDIDYTMNNACVNNKIRSYREDLAAYLACNHPDYLNQHDLTSAGLEDFLVGRAHAAVDEEIRMTTEGLPPRLAEKYAREVLLQGLRFSLHVIIREILDTDYPNIKAEISSVMVAALERSCRPIAAKFAMGDDYLTDPIYSDFIEEIKLHIHNFLIENI